jgi:hypothetical protein
MANVFYSKCRYDIFIFFMTENLENEFSSWKPLATNLCSSRMNRGSIRIYFFIMQLRKNKLLRYGNGMCGKGNLFLTKPSAANLFSWWMRPRNVTVFQMLQKHCSSNPFLYTQCVIEIIRWKQCAEHQNMPESSSVDMFPRWTTEEQRVARVTACSCFNSGCWLQRYSMSG